jgi:hypothetical protein
MGLEEIQQGNWWKGFVFAHDKESWLWGWHCYSKKWRAQHGSSFSNLLTICNHFFMSNAYDLMSQVIFYRWWNGLTNGSRWEVGKHFMVTRKVNNMRGDEEEHMEVSFDTPLWLCVMKNFKIIEIHTFFLLSFFLLKSLPTQEFVSPHTKFILFFVPFLTTYYPIMFSLCLF